jgi:hypothetical protein
MKYAFNDNGVLRDVVMTHPNMLFILSYAEQFIEVPDEAQNGWLWDGETATEPSEPEDIFIENPTITKEELLAQLQALQTQINALGD